MLLKTHSELLKHKWAKVTCEIGETKIDDARIQVEWADIFICQNERDWLAPSDKLWYNYWWVISGDMPYERYNRNCTNITLIEEPKLPKYFAIKECDNPLWKKYIEWLNEKVGTPWRLEWRDKNAYYGFIDDHIVIESYKKDLKRHLAEVITLEEWNEIVNREPKKEKIKNVKAKLTYETIYKRSDGVEFKKGYIGGESIETLQERRKNHLSEANKITGKLKEYNRLFK